MSNMMLSDALDQLSKLADFLDAEIESCAPDDEFVIAPMWGVTAMRATTEALRIVVNEIDATHAKNLASYIGKHR